MDYIIRNDRRKVPWHLIWLVSYMHSASMGERIVLGREIKSDVDVLNTIHTRHDAPSLFNALADARIYISATISCHRCYLDCA